ncbi:MAG: peptidoglycan-binding domain-containing protein [Candidatus Paceibacterota bacterium]
MIKKNYTFFIIVTSIFLLSSGNLAQAVQFPISRTLKVGMSGEDVKVLQKILNQDSTTRISSVGIGSSGQESTYFGALTRNAVIRLQEKYKNEILTPNGLSFGTGIVGPSTLKVLSLLFQGSATVSTTVIPTNSTATNINIPTNPTIVPISTTVTVPKVPANPNLNNLSTFIDSFEKVSKKQGLSNERIAFLKDKILKDVATSTDLKKEFMKLVENDKNISKNNEIDGQFPIKTAFNEVFELLKDSFVPKEAFAGVGTPFGGPLIYSFYCDCSASWLLTIGPLPPTMVTLLTYTVGSQAHLSYNIPKTSWLLGDYTKLTGQCLVNTGETCGSLPSEGHITPTVGSSPN